MSTDLKIEIFACKLFHTIWYDMQIVEVVPDILEIYGAECAVDDTYKEACDDLFIKAVCCRSNLLSKIYDSKIDSLFQEIKKIKSLSEVYEYIVRFCDSDDIFGHLTVFGKMLATSEFAANILCSIHEKIGFSDVLRYGHILWAMYFDKFTDEFYEEGGWNELKREAKSYTFLSEFDEIFHVRSNFYLRYIKEAIVNYCCFKRAIDYQERKHKYSAHVSKLWIKFRIEHLESYTNIPSSYDTSVTAYEAELLLNDLKLLLDPRCSQKNIEISTEKYQGGTSSTEMSCSEIHCASEDGGFSPISTDYEEESQSRCLTSTKEELTLDIDSNGNRELDENNPIGIELLKQTSSASSTKNSRIEQNLLPAIDMKRKSETIKKLPNASNLDLGHSYRSKSCKNKNKDDTIELFCEGNVDEKTEITNTDQVLSFHQLEKTECHRKTSTTEISGFSNESINNGNEVENFQDMLKMRLYSKKGQAETSETKDVSSISQIVASDLDGLSLEPSQKDFSSMNETVEGNEVENFQDMLKMRLYSKKGSTETSETKDVSSISQIVASDLERLSGEPSQKDFSSVNEVVNFVEERREIRRAREDLRNEQKDPEVKKFLKMLLVLGDIEGKEFILSTLENDKEHPENSQESMNQQKKRSKKKKSKK